MNMEYEEFDRLGTDDIWDELESELDLFTIYIDESPGRDKNEKYMHVAGNGTEKARGARSVEVFVEALIKRRRKSIEDVGDISDLARKHFRDVIKLEPLMMMPHEFSEEVMLVASVLEQLCPDRVWATHLGAFDHSSGMTGKALFEKVALTVMQRFGEPEYRKRRRRRLERARRNFASGKQYFAALFAKYPRLLVLRIDLHYRDGLAPENGYASKMPARQLRRDIGRMLNNSRSNTLFDGLVGHLGKIEQGTTRGFHAHMFFFFDGDVRWQDGWLAKRLCEYWKSMTNGDGTSYPCNMNKNKYRRLGIGMIHRDDLDKRSVLLTCLAYVTKSEQYLRVDAGKGRNFFHGEA